jgi:hypothetical protein
VRDLQNVSPYEQRRNLQKLNAGEGKRVYTRRAQILKSGAEADILASDK